MCIQFSTWYFNRFQNALVGFMQNLRAKLGAHRVISLAVVVNQTAIEYVYDFRRLNHYVDFYNVLTFDLVQSNETSYRTPLYQTSVTESPSRLTSIDQVVQLLIDREATAAKLLVGLALHAQTFTLASTHNNDLHAPVSGPGNAGPLTERSGLLSYTEVCTALDEQGWTIVNNQHVAGVYAYKGDQWMSYETPRTMSSKQVYAKDLQLGGIMVWSIDMDDVSYVCGSNPNMLMEALWQT